MDFDAQLYHDLLQFAGMPDDSRHRLEMLHLARRLSGQPIERVAAFLWLFDEEKRCLHLDYHYPDDSPRSRISLKIPDDRRRDKEFITGAIKAVPEIDSWLKEYDFGLFPTLFPVEGEGHLGFLNYFAPHDVKDSQFIEGLCSAIAARISRHRFKRKLDINDKLVNTSWEIATTANGWLQAAADTTKEHTKAKLVLVFRLSMELHLEAVAAAPREASLPLFGATRDSLVHKIYNEKSKRRILNHYDEEERIREFLTAQYDDKLVTAIESFLGEQLRSWIGAAICYGNDPMAVMLVANKDEKQYFPAVFSRTDYGLVESVCQLASKAMPQVQTNAAIRQISSATFEQQSFGTPAAGSTRLERVFSAVREHIPGLVGAAIGIRIRAFEPCVLKESTILGDGDVYDLLLRRVKTRKSVSGDTPPVAASGFWYLDLDLPNPGDRVATLHLLLRRPSLAAHEREILDYVCLDLGQFVRDQQALQSQERQLIEFRHAIRSGLQGLGHLDTACDAYEDLTRRGFESSGLRASILSKSLKWAKLFATRTRHLVEETRFLIDEIRRDQLRFADCDIGRMVKEVIKCLQPDSEKRHIGVVFNNLMNPMTRAVVDRFLVDISLFNLLDNAIKYSFRDREIRVRLELQKRNWVFTIENFGVYIPPEDYEIIFRPRVRRPTGPGAEIRPGTGIGLAVVKQVVEAHGGTVIVKSFLENRIASDCGALTIFVVSVPMRPS